MIGRQQFDRIRARHGPYASWAVWAKASETPKSNIGDLSTLDPDANPSLLETLKDDVVMVGLNLSRPFKKLFRDEPFRNFHDPRPEAHDFKIRYAFTNTAYYGAYMTDIIKNVEKVESAALLQLLRADPSLIQASVGIFLEELADLGSGKPAILAFGAAAHELVAKHVPANAYSRLTKVRHYSDRIGKEEYRRIVLRQADSQ